MRARTVHRIVMPIGALCVACFVATFWVYWTAPRTPQPAEHRTLPLSNHGVTVYATKCEAFVATELPFIAGGVFFAAAAFRAWHRRRSGVVDPITPTEPRRIDGSPRWRAPQ